jgi:hypothetical protein
LVHAADGTLVILPRLPPIHVEQGRNSGNDVTVLVVIRTEAGSRFTASFLYEVKQALLVSY